MEPLVTAAPVVGSLFDWESVPADERSLFCDEQLDDDASDGGNIVEQEVATLPTSPCHQLDKKPPPPPPRPRRVVILHPRPRAGGKKASAPNESAKLRPLRNLDAMFRLDADVDVEMF